MRVSYTTKLLILLAVLIGLSTGVIHAQIDLPQQYLSQDGRVAFRYPTDWMVTQGSSSVTVTDGTLTIEFLDPNLAQSINQLSGSDDPQALLTTLLDVLAVEATQTTFDAGGHRVVGALAVEDGAGQLMLVVQPINNTLPNLAFVHITGPAIDLLSSTDTVLAIVQSYGGLIDTSSIGSTSPPVPLAIGQMLNGVVDSSTAAGDPNATQRYVFNASATMALILTVNSRDLTGGSSIRLEDAITGDVLTMVTARVSGISLRIPPGNQAYILVVSNSNRGQLEAYTIELAVASTGVATPTPTPAPVQPTPLPPTPIFFITPLPQSGPCVVAPEGASAVNVRSAPSTDASIVSSLVPNTQTFVIGRLPDNSWWQVNLNGITGWAAGFVLRLGGVCGNVPVVNPPQLPPPTSATDPFISFTTSNNNISPGDCVTISWDVRNIREVFYQGDGVVGQDSRIECPTQTTTYQLRVITGRAIEIVREITISVSNTPGGGCNSGITDELPATRNGLLNVGSSDTWFFNVDPCNPLTTVTVAMTATNLPSILDSFVQVFDQDDTLLGQDDDNGGNLNARAIVFLPPGTTQIRVVAASFAGATGGTYQVQVFRS